jgi:hypothetical protein
VRRTTFSATTSTRPSLTLACAIICWRRTAEPLTLPGPLRRQRLLSGWLSTRRL